MEKNEFSDLLLLTAFSVMACDGDIDPKEVTLISDLEKKESLFNIENLEVRLNQLVEEINKNGHIFLRNYFKKLKQAELTHDQESKLVAVTIKMIEADEIVQYTELRFFKIIHSYLVITGDEILEDFSHVADIEDYVVQDIISEKYIEKLTTSYFDNQEIPEFAEIKVHSNE
ncbi:hypothetical protein E1176_16790 [Fulvivirga sp. RKSG066]|uniref:hypothetical protein n=1 Tax=Fulvivirga aurantia TaxID=2529383 RepID=UPI0012BC2EEE|nr:hypothetical protein [Fulvivirga aurantia]MTI22692.1 hypothetical protein [Fulvivirga aurantia]